LSYQNNFIGTLKMSNIAKNFNVLTISLSVLQNYSSNLYLAKILDLSVKPFFSCV